jgi:hypothetical protein
MNYLHAGGSKISRRNNVDNKFQYKEHICLKEEINVTVKRICILHFVQLGARGGEVVQAVRYKPEGRGIDARWCHWNFSLT